MNKLIITGRLTRDAELRYIPNGTPVLSFSVANNTGFGDNEKNQFFDCSLFGKRAEGKLKDFMKKGKQVLVEGEVSIKTYKKQDGSNGASLSPIRCAERREIHPTAKSLKTVCFYRPINH